MAEKMVVSWVGLRAGWMTVSKVGSMVGQITDCWAERMVASWVVSRV